MKKLFLLSLLACLAFVGTSYASTLDDAINMADKAIQTIDLESSQDLELEKAIVFLHADDITKYDTVETFMPYQNIRRDEAAKMYVNFQKNTLWNNDMIVWKICKFTDTSLWHSDLVGLMNESCLRGLFNGHAWLFMPTKPITNAQAVIVLIRMIDGNKIEPSNDHYAVNYMSAAENLWLLDGLEISDRTHWDDLASRATIAKLLFRAVKEK